MSELSFEENKFEVSEVKKEIKENEENKKEDNNLSDLNSTMIINQQEEKEEKEKEEKKEENKEEKKENENLSSTTNSITNSNKTNSSSTFIPQLSPAQLELLYGQTLSVIIPSTIYLSDFQAALDEKLLKMIGITHIINASNGTVPNQFPHLFEYYNVNIEDEDESDITPYFHLVEEFLENTPPDEKRILFHCRLGISRSPALVIAYLMKHSHLTLKECYERTKSKRSKIQPTLSFCKSLMEYEKVLYPQLEDNSITIQALCGGNQRYSIVSRQSIQRQSSLEDSLRFSNSRSLHSTSQSLHSQSLHLIKEDELQKQHNKNQENKEENENENENIDKKDNEKEKESSCCCCCIV